MESDEEDFGAGWDEEDAANDSDLGDDDADHEGLNDEEVYLHQASFVPEEEGEWLSDLVCLHRRLGLFPGQYMAGLLVSRMGLQTSLSTHSSEHFAGLATEEDSEDGQPAEAEEGRGDDAWESGQEEPDEDADEDADLFESTAEAEQLLQVSLAYKRPMYCLCCTFTVFLVT